MKEIKFIAEMSGNHGGSLKRALQLVDAAASGGATHLKVQTFTPDTITLNSDGSDYVVKSEHELWANRSLYDLYSEAALPYEWHAEIFDHARKCGLVPFSSPFDELAVDFLVDLGVELIKIASLEIVDLPLIAKASSTGLPMIMSTGTASLKEVDDAVQVARRGGCQDLTLLVCTSEYPASVDSSNLLRLGFLKERFGCSVGFSDHTIGVNASLAAVALGASAIEKHIRLSGDNDGVDAAFSSDPDEFELLVKSAMEVLTSLGGADAWDLPIEAESRRFRPSIIATKDLMVGDVVTLSNVATLRPNIGLSPKFLPLVLGSSVVKPIMRGEGLSFDSLDADAPIESWSFPV